MIKPEIHGHNLTLEVLAGQLAQAVGQDKAREVVVATARMLGIAGPSVTRDEALAVLAEVAETPGIVGVCARFARTRVMLLTVPTNPPG